MHISWLYTGTLHTKTSLASQTHIHTYEHTKACRHTSATQMVPVRQVVKAHGLGPPPPASLFTVSTGTHPALPSCISQPEAQHKHKLGVEAQRPQLHYKQARK